MSEASFGYEPPPPSPPRDSAIALLWRDAPGGREVFWLQRGQQLAFAGGMYAFPGGKLDPADATVPVRGATGPEAALIACAARELFEEAGILAARGRISAAERARLRDALVAGTLPFARLLADHGLSLDARDFLPAGRWITPPFLPAGFDARLFLVEAPAEQEARALPGECAEGAFIRPREALARWSSGRALLHPPTHNALEALALPTLPEALDRLRRPRFVRELVAERIEFQEGIVLVPLRTPTLPPATHTNCYVAGLAETVIVDPGSDEPTELQQLVAMVRALEAEGRRPVAVLATHHHQDHVGGVRAAARALGLPVWAHALTAEKAGLDCGRLLSDGEELGLPGFPLVALHTPGHTRGHLALHHPPSGAVLAGDLVSSLSTIVIDPPEGNMADYLASLRRLLALPVATIFPAHGAPIVDGPGKLREYLQHRAAREAQILAAVRAGAESLAAVVASAYADTPPFLHPIAERSALAHLEKLAGEGSIARAGERFLAA